MLLFLLITYNSSAQVLSPVPEAIQQAQQSIYKIQKKGVYGNGTGFFISPHLLVTNFHGVGSLNLENERFNEIELYRGDTLSSLKIKRLVAVSALFDLAILETSTPADSYLTINKQVPVPSEYLFTIGYPQGTLITQQKTGTLLNWEHNYCFIGNQSPFENVNGVSGSPVLNEKGEVAGVIYSSVINMRFATNPDKIEQLIANEIGTNCNHFDRVKSCVDSELSFVENEMQQGNEFAQYLGMIQWSTHHKSQLMHNMKQSINNLTPEQREIFFTEMDHKFDTLDTQTLHWHTLSAQQGYAPAQYALGLHYYYGEKMEQDFQQAFYWMKQAAEQNYAPAQYMLSIFYHDGDGTPKNIQQAINWLIQSADQGYMPAQLELAQAYSIGDGIEENSLKAFQWYKKSAQEGFKIAQYIVAIDYIEGEVTRQDWNQALYWLKQSAQQGYLNALRNLSAIYYNGDEIPRDLDQAFYWTKKAAQQEDLESQFRLFTLYYNGEGTPKNSEQALHWLETAAENGHKPAQKVLAEYSESSSPSILDWIKELFSKL